MGKKLEEKILEEIKRRVLEKERENAEKQESEAVREATQEALAEMTSLSRKEVDNIAVQVRQEMLKKQEKQKRLYIAIGMIALLGLYIAYTVSKNKTQQSTTTTTTSTNSENLFVETFDNNANNWDIFNNFEQKRYFENNRYIFETNEADYCYWDYVSLQLPENYTVEVSSTWLKGKFDDYGVIFQEQINHYYIFQMKADGDASVAAHVGEDWVESQSWTKNMCKTGDGTTSNVQKIEVNGNNYKYFINNKLFRSGDLKNLKISMIGLRVCDEQKVAFNSVKVTNSKTGEVLLNENFSNPHAEWEPKNEMEKESSIANGKYTFTGFTEDMCYWASVPVTISYNCEVTLKMSWQKGEMANFGLMVMQNDENYYGCEVRNDGNARLIKCESTTYTEIPDYMETNVEIDKDITVIQKVKISGGEIEYYVNDKLVGKSTINYMQLQQIGLRICGRQTVSFDEIKVQNF